MGRKPRIEYFGMLYKEETTENTYLKGRKIWITIITSCCKHNKLRAWHRRMAPTQ